VYKLFAAGSGGKQQLVTEFLASNLSPSSARPPKPVP
jgi:hypothetical protein